MLDLADRRRACEDTIRRSPDIAATAKDNSSSPGSTFISAQLPPLDKSSPRFPGLSRKPVEIYDSDAFALVRALGFSRTSSTSASETNHGRVGVLNLASDREPGGGWRYTLSKTQEEALCYSSTLYATLKPEWFPFPNTGPGSCAGIISPDVVVFKDTLDHELVDLPAAQRHLVTVLTVAAPCFPKLTDNGEEFSDESQLDDLREKITLVLRMAAANGVTSLVLGAMGCGAYGCPPRAVAREMKSIIEKDEFTGWFESIVFAVYAAGPSGKRNFDIFKEVFAEVP